MTCLDLHITAYLSGPILVAALVLLGLVIGILSGLFGVGGAFLLNPLLIVAFGIDGSVVVGSSLSFTLGTATAGLGRHLRGGNVEPRAVTILGVGAIIGAVLGSWMHEATRRSLGPEDFDTLVLVLFLILLLFTAWLVGRRSAAEEGPKALSPLQRMRLRPKVTLPKADLENVSLPGLVLVGVAIGVVTGMLGVGGGVLFMPLLLLVVGLTAHQAVGTSLGVVLFGATAATIEHARAGDVNLWIAMALLVGSSVGVQIGAYICDRLHAKHLRRWFAIVVLLAAGMVAAKLAFNLATGNV